MFSRSSSLLNVVLLSGIYFLFGQLGLLLISPPEYATLIWPPTGIALGALIFYGRYLWKGIVIGAIVFNLNHILQTSGDTVPLSSMIAVSTIIGTAATVQAVAGYELIKKYVGIPVTLTRVKQAMFLFVLGGPIACLISATISTLALYSIDIVSISAIPNTWFTWWMGDIFGVFVFFPLMFLMPMGKGRRLFIRNIQYNFPALAIFTVILPLGLTFYSWKISREYIFEKNRLYVEKVIKVAELTLDNRLNAYEQYLVGGTSFFKGSAEINRREWREYVETLDLQQFTPGLNGIGFIDAVPRSGVSKFLSIQKALKPDFSIHPVTTSPESFVITYIEPLDTNRQALGLNIAFEKNRFDAAITARDTGQTAISGKITLVQDAEKNAGFLLLHPIFTQPKASLKTPEDRRKNFKGWIYAPLIGKNILTTLPFYQDRMLNVRIYDSEEASSESLVYDTAVRSGDAAARHHIPLFKTKTITLFFQQNWRVEWSSTPELEASIKSNEPEIILIFGLLLSALMGGVIFALSYRAENVEILVNEKIKEISTNQNRMTLLIKHTPAAVAMLDKEMRYIAASDRWCQEYGMDSSQVPGKSHYEIHPELKDMPEWMKAHERVLNGEIINSGEAKWVWDGKTSRWLHYALYPWIDVHGKVGGAVIFTEDVTEKKKIDQELKASEEKFRAAMEYASIGKALVNIEGVFMQVNQSFSDFIGYSQEELLKMDFRMITYPDDLEKDLEHLKSLTEGINKAYQFEKRYIHKNGDILWGMLSVSLVRDHADKPHYYVAEIADITRAKEIDRIKDEFISITSHELRTPITSINLALNLLQKSLPDLPADQMQIYVDMAYKNSNRLIYLINDILDLKKISAGQMVYKMTPVDLPGIIQQTVNENIAYGQKYDVTFTLSPVPGKIYIDADAARLSQVITNLLSNGAKFSHRGGRVDIRIERNDGKVVAYFQDYGIGIPEKFQAFMFQKFSQADSSMTRKQEGTGLGLFLCKEMVEKMDGKIGFKSVEGQGATFWFEFDEVSLN